MAHTFLRHTGCNQNRNQRADLLSIAEINVAPVVHHWKIRSPDNVMCKAFTEAILAALSVPIRLPRFITVSTRCPNVFISATSADLRSWRQVVKEAVLTLQCFPVEMGNYDLSSDRVEEMLRGKMKTCDAVIHLVGECYGFEPAARDPRQPRRSYTQLEYDLARQLRKPCFRLICAEGFPYDKHPPEDEERQRLQRGHRAALMADDRMRYVVSDPHELKQQILKLQIATGRLRALLGRVLTIGLLLILALWFAVFLVHHRAAQTEHHVEKIEDELARYRSAVKAVADRFGRDLEPDRLLSAQEKLDRALTAVASEQKISVAELRTWMRLFVETVRVRPGANAYDRALADFADQNFADAEKHATQAAEDLQRQRKNAEHASGATAQLAGDWAAQEREAWSLAGKAAYAAGHYADAIAHFNSSLVLFDETRNPVQWCDAAHVLASALLEQGQYQGAKSLLRHLVETRARIQGASHPDTLACMNNYALVLMENGDYEAAAQLFEKVHRTLEHRFGKEHPKTLVTAHNQGLLLTTRGDYEAAEKLHAAILELRERILGPNHPDTLASVDALAGTLAMKSDVVAARKLFQRSIDGYRRLRGAEHPSTLERMSNLASLLTETRDYEAAEPLLNAVLETQERTLGWEHPATLGTGATLASLLKNTGKLDAAESLYRRVIRTQEQILGSENPHTLATVNNFAVLVMEQGDLEAAEATLHKLLLHFEHALGRDHPSTLACANNLASVLARRDQYAAAEPYCLRVLGGFRKVLGKDHFTTAKAAYNYSLMFWEQRRWAEARPLALEAVAIVQRRLPTGHPDRVLYEKYLAEVERKIAKDP